ncbi:VanZ family protein [Bacillus sp. T3]|uniref:VanZ family protein n=1 Tax=Bacillus sp. T3 TaxID=467262 RepID=UPI0029823954|nr:VanZ family protein [Bacillus sp. T3]
MPSNALVELPALSVDHFIKESLHLIEFGILYWLLVVACLTTGRLTERASLICALVAAAYGVSDEIHQSFYPYRSATIIDLVKDWIGVSVSWYIVRQGFFRGVRFARVGKLFKRFQGYFSKEAV